MIEYTRFDAVQQMMNHGSLHDVKFAIRGGFGCDRHRPDYHELTVKEKVDKPFNRGCLLKDQTLAMFASRHGRLDVLRHVIELNADLTARDSRGATALHHASEHLEAAKILVEAGVDINSQDMEERTPLMCCAIDGNHKAAKMLIANGARTDICDNKGRTAADLARSYKCFSGTAKILQMLQSK